MKDFHRFFQGSSVLHWASGGFCFQKLAFLDLLDMPICEKVHISSYLDIFQMTAAAAAAAAAASQELSPSGKTPGASRAGTKYPVQGNPSLR